MAVTLRENALTTLDALKTSLGIDPDEEDAQRDATLVQLINAASAWLETQLGRKLGKSTYRQRYCGTGTQQLSLEQYPPALFGLHQGGNARRKDRHTQPGGIQMPGVVGLGRVEPGV